MHDYLIQERKTNISKKLAIWGGLSLIVVGSIFGIYQIFSISNQGQVNGINIGEGDYVLGPQDAKVTLVEFSDLQCPACASFMPSIKQLNADFPKDLRIVYKHFPLREIHSNANLAAYSAEAAGKQGKFWEMVEALFANQQVWAQNPDADRVMESIAIQLGMDMDKFRSDMTSQEARTKVDEDLALTETLGLNSTPTFFLNGKKLSTPRSYEQFKDLIEDAINE